MYVFFVSLQKAVNILYQEHLMQDNPHRLAPCHRQKKSKD